MPAMELLTGFVTAPGSTLTALTMSAGNSLTVRNAPFESRVHLIQAWAHNQGDGALEIRSPQLHDNVDGIFLDVFAGEIKPLLPTGFRQRLVPQDTLSVALSGSNTAGHIESAALLVYYENLPGIAARFATPELVKQKMKHLVTVNNTLALGTAGGYSGEEALNAETDLLKNNTDYALLGYLVDVQCAAVRIRGADTGNLGVGGPGDRLGRHYTSDWFVRLSMATGLPCIPVFNAANRAGILVDGVQNQGGADPTVTWIFAELAP